MFYKRPVRGERSRFISFFCLFFMFRWIRVLVYIAFKRVLSSFFSFTLLWENEIFGTTVSQNTAHEGDDDR